MKVTISIIIFIMKIGFIYSDMTSEWKGWSEKCCEILYKDDNNFQKDCVNHLVKDFTGTFSEINIRVHLKNKEVVAKRNQIYEILNLPENKEKLEGLTKNEDKERVKDQILRENKSQIDAVSKEARTKRVKDFTGTFQKTCELVSEEVAAINDPKTFTVDVISLIITSEIFLTTSEINKFFIKHLNENKEDVEKLKELGPDLWQKLIYIDKQVFDFMKTCNCKDILLSTNFDKFLNWVIEYKRANVGRYELCSLEKYVKIYNKYKALIDEDPKKHETTIIQDVKDCKI